MLTLAPALRNKRTHSSRPRAAAEISAVAPPWAGSRRSKPATERCQRCSHSVQVPLPLPGTPHVTAGSLNVLLLAGMQCAAISHRARRLHIRPGGEQDAHALCIALPRGAAESGGPVGAVSAVRRRSAVQKQPQYVIVPSQSCKVERRASRALRNVSEKKRRQLAGFVSSSQPVANSRITGQAIINTCTRPEPRRARRAPLRSRGCLGAPQTAAVRAQPAGSATPSTNCQQGRNICLILDIKRPQPNNSSISGWSMLC